MEDMGTMFMLWTALLFFTWPADRFVEKYVKTVPMKSILRTLDTAVHGFIGALSWQQICLLCPLLEFSIIYQIYHLLLGIPLRQTNKNFDNFSSWVNRIINFGLAFALSSIIDVDHVLKDFIQIILGGARVPWERGVFHFLLPPLIIILIMYISAIVLSNIWCLKFGTFLVACVVSHLIRDGIHHGLWLQPIGITPILPYWMYVIITMLLPLIMGGLTLRLSAYITKSHPASDDTFNV